LLSACKITFGICSRKEFEDVERQADEREGRRQDREEFNDDPQGGVDRRQSFRTKEEKGKKKQEQAFAVWLTEV
jgi:hypothetical protein